MHRFHISVVIVFAMLALVTSALGGCETALPAGAQHPTQAQTAHYVVTLRPLNASGVSGTVWLDLTGNMLVVTIHASGLEPNKEHYQHIHGNAGGTVACPSPSGADASGLITVDQGLAAVGPIALDLSPYPQVTGQGLIAWSRSYTLTTDDLSSLSPLTGHVVVLHGMTYRGVYDRALFVACGPIHAT